MRIYNETPFKVSHAHSKLQPGQPFVTLVVKGTFQLVAGSVCTALPADAQLPISKSTKFADEIGNSLRTDADMVPFKPRADCLLIGSAYAPGGNPTKSLVVAFGVGQMLKHLTISGEREWLRLADGSITMTDQRAFVEMPIREEHAHGGPRSRFNKHGIGFREPGTEPGSRVPVANIHNLGEGTARWDQDAPSAGFGVIPSQLQPRRALAGTFDDDWRYRRHPLPPADFDPAHMNAARADQQIEGFLVGDEELYFEHLHPDHETLKAWLPGLRVRCFANRTLDPAHADDLEFGEVLTCLDTCLVDMKANTVTLLWRGTLEMLDDQHTRIQHMLICQEPLAAPLDLDYYVSLMMQKIEGSTFVPAAGMGEEDRKKKIDALNTEGITRVLGMLEKGKADPAIIAKVRGQKDMTGIMAIVQEWVEEIKKTMPDPPSSGGDA